MNKILITGGEGYIGSKLKTALELRGHAVDSLDKPHDIRDTQTISQFLKGKDACFHLAAITNINEATTLPAWTFEVNVEGTKNVAGLCAYNEVKLYFTSTVALYGEPKRIPSEEGGPLNPMDTYASSKIAAEEAVRMWGFSEGLDYTIFRLGTVYGPSTDPNLRKDMCIPIFTRQAMDGKKLTIHSDGMQERCYIYINDLISAMIRAMDRDLSGETINLAGKEVVTINSVAKTILKVTGQPSNHFVHEPKRKGDFKHQVISIDKAIKLLDWYPQTRMDEGLTNYYKFLKSHG